MTKIKHRFLNHKVDPNSQTIVIGTFNPDTPKNVADFFYGRQRNFLWTLMPGAFGKESLKGKSKREKVEFIKMCKIDFIDLISEVDVDEVANYNDAYLDNKVSAWRDVVREIERLSKLKRICITRKTLSDIPHMKVEIEKIKTYCEQKNIFFECLPTPARYYNKDKQDKWTEFFTSKSREKQL